MRLPALSTIVFWIVVICVVMWFIKDPVQAANLVKGAGRLITQIAHALSVFVSSL